LVLKFVEKQTSEICLEAVKQNKNAFMHIDKEIFDDLLNIMFS